jgi:hypothetical protein
LSTSHQKRGLPPTAEAARGNLGSGSPEVLLADEQIWSLDNTLARVIGAGVRRLREMDHGHPGQLTQDGWREILDEMVSGFEQYAAAEDASEDPDYAALEHSLDLFKTWFCHLWD